MSGITLDELVDVIVTATDLDIRDLVNATDSVAIGDETDIIDMQTLDVAFEAAAVTFPISGVRRDAGTSPVDADGDAHPLVFDNIGQLKVATSLTSAIADDDPDAGNPIKMGGRGVTGLLTALSATNDRYDLLGDIYRRTWVNTSANIAIKTTAETVGTSVAEVVAVPLAGRRTITIQNEGTADVFFGPTGITTATGMKVSKKSSATYDFAEDIAIFMISGSAGQDVRILEAG